MTKRHIALSSMFALALLLSVGFLGAHTIALFVVAALLDVGLYRCAPTLSRRAIFVITAIAGPLSEIIAIHFGAWIYTYPAFAGIPLWLPLVWGGAGMYIATLSAYLVSKD